MTASVAKVAFNGSDSNHLCKMCHKRRREQEGGKFSCLLWFHTLAAMCTCMCSYLQHYVLRCIQTTVCNLSWKLEQSQAQKRQVDHSLSWKLTSEREGEGEDRRSVEMLCLKLGMDSSILLNLLKPQSEWGNQVRRMVSHELKLGMESCALEMTWRRPLKILGAFQSWIEGGRNSASYDTWCSEIDNLTAYIPVFVRAARGWRAESRLWREPWVSLYRSTGPQSSKGSIHLAARAKHSTTTLGSTGVI